MERIIELVKKFPDYTTNLLINEIPYFREFYSNNYSRYKFLNCTIKNRLNILKPEQFVHWLSTYDCNFHCKHCEANAGNKNASELTTDEALKLMTELAKMKIKRVWIGGGEPLVRKDIFIIISHIMNTGMQYGISSNGYLVDKYKEEFSKYKPYMFFTSIDGLEDTNDEIRGSKGAFRKSLQSLKFFKSINVRYRVVNTVVVPNNIEQLPELKEIILNSDATFWRFALAISVGRARDNDQMHLSIKQIKYLFDFVKETKKEFDVEITEDAGYLGCLALKVRNRPFFCGAGITRCSIMPDGEVLGCQIAYDNRFSEGNVKDKSFKEIWQKGFSRFRNPQFDKDYNKECLSCEYFKSCRGGCWGMRLGNRHCLKAVWGEQNVDSILSEST